MTVPNPNINRWPIDGMGSNNRQLMPLHDTMLAIIHYVTQHHKEADFNTLMIDFQCNWNALYGQRIARDLVGRFEK